MQHRETAYRDTIQVDFGIDINDIEIEIRDRSFKDALLLVDVWWRGAKVIKA